MKSHFLYKGHDRPEWGKWFSVVYPSVYYDAVLDETDMTPWGFWTDYSSVPRVPGAYILTGNTEHPAAKHHDKDYRWMDNITRWEADKKFHRAMIANGDTHPKQSIPYRFGRSLRRGAMFTAVVAGGWFAPKATPGCLNYLQCTKAKLSRGCIYCEWYFCAWKHCKKPGYVPHIVGQAVEVLKTKGQRPEDFIVGYPL